ncbi:transposase [Cupriavidus sp. TA19]|uniref:recombinase family protein n=1 Tax=unclassified Cupriavidus TaxID=2640874 RepID=UPI000E2F0492|nr:MULTISPECIES: recombinase family protein [unclassified Cupriavidus]BDB23249.1 recombinase family protein [Cupriavidus sp. P-10]GLC91382.1 transposase [Cupriavidus sp. TA19]
MPSTFIYSNRAGDLDAMEDELRIADRAGYTVDLRCAFWESEPASVPAGERPRLLSLLQRVRAGDIVVTMQLCCLGWSVQEVLGTIRKFRLLGVALHCVQLSRANLASAAPPEAVMVLRTVAALEGSTRSARVRDSLAAAKAMGRAVGRPPKHKPEERDAILRALAEGQSVSETARRFNTSRQTVLRIRAAAPATILLPPVGDSTEAEADAEVSTAE